MNFDLWSLRAISLYGWYVCYHWVSHCKAWILLFIRYSISHKDHLIKSNLFQNKKLLNHKIIRWVPVITKLSGQKAMMALTCSRALRLAIKCPQSSLPHLERSLCSRMKHALPQHSRQSTFSELCKVYVTFTLLCCCHIPYLVVHYEALVFYHSLWFTVALHNTIILIITPNQPLNQLLKIKVRLRQLLFFFRTGSNARHLSELLFYQWWE